MNSAHLSCRSPREDCESLRRFVALCPDDISKLHCWMCARACVRLRSKARGSKKGTRRIDTWARRRKRTAASLQVRRGDDARGARSVGSREAAKTTVQWPLTLNANHAAFES